MQRMTTEHMQRCIAILAKVKGRGAAELKNALAKAVERRIAR